MFACLYAPPRGLVCRVVTETTQAVAPTRQNNSDTDQLVHLAREYSPRVEVHRENLVMLDASGLANLFGNTSELGATLRRAAADRGLQLRIAIASTRTAALLIVQERSGLTVIKPGQEADTLSGLSLDVLKALARNQTQGNMARRQRGAQVSSDTQAVPVFALLSTMRRWGIRTLGDLARLPPSEIFERLGAGGVTLQRFARGEDGRPLVPMSIEERFESSLALERPIEGLEPLSFVLGRLFEQLSVRLERAGSAAAVIHVHLKLVTCELHTRTLQPPTPLRDPRTLRALALLDLESHPPAAGIDQVTVVIDHVPARVQQFSLLEESKPSPETVSTLVARLTALVGARHCGSPLLFDSHNAGSFEMCAFAPSAVTRSSAVLRQKKALNLKKRETDGQGGFRAREVPLDGDWRRAVRPQGRRPLMPMLRRFREPPPACVRVQRGRPVEIVASQVSKREVVQCAGPWRMSGEWWDGASAEGVPVALSPVASSVRAPWDHDEWDVSLADGGVYRIFHDRQVDRWFLAGMID